MSSKLNRRNFMKKTIASSATGALAMSIASPPPVTAAPKPPAANALPCGNIAGMSISRILLGGNLLTHYTHSRDLKYVYSLAAQYNTEKKIMETLEEAENNGINTLVIHTVPWAMKILRAHRKRGGKIQWIICPTADINDSMEAYKKGVQEVADMGTDAIYLWGVRSDALVAQKRIDLIAKAVEIAKEYNIPSGVGAHDIRVVEECEKHNVDTDFYIKTFHHHNYPTAPRPDEIKGIISEVPGYWCKDPKRVIDVMKKVEKPWLAFKVMAAGAIPPENAFQYAFDNGADHVLAGMFDFEIAQDARIAKSTLAKTKRTRKWYS